MVRAGGLLTGKKDPVALKSIAVTLSIHDFVAGVSATLNYENEEKVPLEAFFVFPMDEDSAVYSFEALVDGKKIAAELQDKMTAHSNYEGALSQGFQAYLLEEDKCSRDVFCCNVGNLTPGSKVALTLKYVQELSLEADGALRYVLPAILNPRYHLSDRCADSCLDLKTPIVPLKDLPYTLSMVATVSSQHGIERIQSNCPLSPTEYLGDDKTSAQVSLAEGHKFDRDVELLIYYSKVHKPSVAVEMGMPEMKPESLMGAPSAMVSFYPDIPEVEASMSCGEFVFLMDRSGSMQSPLSKQDKSQLRIDAAKETLILLLKSLPEGCYFNIYGFGSSYKAFFPESVKYTQKTMEEAVKRVKLMSADLGGTEILTPLQKIYRSASIPGHPLQIMKYPTTSDETGVSTWLKFSGIWTDCTDIVFVFTDGEVTDTFSVIREVKFNSKKHRCFSFGIGEGASTSLIKSIARVSGGTSEFITGKDRMQSKALRSLKRSLQSVVEDISLSWSLPPSLSVNMISPEQTAIFKDQRLIFYAQLTGVMPLTEVEGEVCLKYTLYGNSFEEKVPFSLQPKPDANLTIHRLAAKSLIQTKDMGFRETLARDKKEVLRISLESGVMSSFTAFIAINRELNQPVQGPLAHREIPRPVLFSASSSTRSSIPAVARPSMASFAPRSQRQVPCCATMSYQRIDPSQQLVNQGITSVPLKETTHKMSKTHLSANTTRLKKSHKVFSESDLVQLICLQNANGSWDMEEDLAKVLGTTLEDMQAAHPTQLVEPSVWSTVLAVLWLHAKGRDLKCEWDLLERKAVFWIRRNAGSTITTLVKNGNAFLKSSVDPAIIAF